MSGFDRDRLGDLLAAHGPLVRVVVAEAKGSVPREPGAAMTVWADGFDGTIGGGALEWEALAEARRMLAAAQAPSPALRRYPLGPALAQCCGGAAVLAYEPIGAESLAAPGDAPAYIRPVGSAAAEPPHAIRAHARALRAGEAAPFLFADGWICEAVAPAKIPLFLYGAGHVGRATVRVFDGLPFALTWVDSAPDRFPAPAARHGATCLPAATPADAVALAPPGAVHLAMTFSHALDLEICHRVLSRGDFARAGVIGSASKSARFRARLRALGHAETMIARLECPIGIPGLGGKAPAEIAISLAADFLGWSAERARLPAPSDGKARA